MNKTLLSVIIGMTFFFSHAGVDARSMDNVNGVLIPGAFSDALREGMSLPLYLHFSGNEGKQHDQQVGEATLLLDKGQLCIRNIRLDDADDSNQARLAPEIAAMLTAEARLVFSDGDTVVLQNGLSISLDFRQLHLRINADQKEMDVVLKPRASDIGKSSVENVTGTLEYNAAAYHSQIKNTPSDTSGYIAFNNVLSYGEHHIETRGTFYGGNDSQELSLYKMMYEHDAGGRRLAAGMLDSWDLQSLGPVTALRSGKIYGMSWGNQANSRVFDDSLSLTPVVVFLPSPGEIHVRRDGKLLSIQQFGMGNHEVDTRPLPWGTYDVQVDVVVNGRVTDSQVQRINKMFGNSANNEGLTWQFWGGMMENNNRPQDNQTSHASRSFLLGASLSGGEGLTNWSFTGYTWDNKHVAEGLFSVPLTDWLSMNTQGMLASDGAWRTSGNVSLTLPAGTGTLWINREWGRSGKQIETGDEDTLSLGTSLNPGTLVAGMGTLSASYNQDQHTGNHYKVIDYSQPLYSGKWGTVGLRTGLREYSSSLSPEQGKYVALDFSLPLGNWFSAGMSSQDGNSLVNMAVRKSLQNSVLTSVNANVSQSVSGKDIRAQGMSGGGGAVYSTRVASGTMNSSVSSRGDLNHSLTARGNVAWSASHVALSGRTDGNAGIIVDTGIEEGASVAARIDGRNITLDGRKSYVPLSPYAQYDIELMNDKNAPDSVEILSGKKNKVTLYPGNVAVLSPDIRRMVTLSGRLRLNGGEWLSGADVVNVNNQTTTDDSGEFILDVDSQKPVLQVKYDGGICEATPDLTGASGAKWLENIDCKTV